LPEVLAQVAHEDAGVRERVAGALGRLGPYGQGAEGQDGPEGQDGLSALVGLARDSDPGVRHAAVASLARSGGDAPAVCDALAEQVGAGADPADPAYAEAARGLAVRQDPRAAGALLRVLADGAPEGPGRAVAVQALAHVRDERVRRRLESTFPRCR
jgi:HEAT repeat protein